MSGTENLRAKVEVKRATGTAKGKGGKGKEY